MLNGISAYIYQQNQGYFSLKKNNKDASTQNFVAAPALRRVPAGLAQVYFAGQQPTIRDQYIMQRLKRLNMRNRNLESCIYGGSRISNADFDNTTIRFTNFFETTISDSRFKGATISGNTNFEGAILSNVSFERATFFDVNFKRAILSNVNFEKATFGENVNFQGTKYTADTKFPKGFNPKEHGMTLVKITEYFDPGPKALNKLRPVVKTEAV